MKDSTSLQATKPVKIWNKEVEINFKDFFKELTKVGLSFYLGSPVGGFKGMIDALKAFKFKDDAGQAAYILIKTALINAAHELANESKHLFELEFEELEKLYKHEDYRKFLKDIDQILEEKELNINRKHLQNPRDIKIVHDFIPFFTQWLEFFGLNKMEADHVGVRFPSYFVMAFIDEWRSNVGRYKLIEDQLFTPAAEAGERELDWYKYREFLQKQTEEPVFEEVFGINKIYVPLRAYYNEKKNDKKLEKGEKVLRVPIWVHKELNLWLSSTDKDDNIKIITGGPGSGKSTLAKMWAAEASQKGNRILFIPLHRFNVKNDISEAIEAFTKLDPYISHNPLEYISQNGNPLILIFDGLDELSKQGSYGQGLVTQFIDQLRQTLLSINQGICRIKILVTGREVAVQAIQNKFRKAKQILQLLPYYIIRLKSEKEKYSKNLEILDVDQRDIWWNKYSNLNENFNFTKIPNELVNPKLDEITAQPLLNYLVGLSLQRGKINFSEQTNLNVVYQDLIEGVYERAYEGKRKHHSLGDLPLDKFTRILEEIAIAAWHGGDVRTTTVKKIQNHIKNSNLNRLFDQFQDGAKSGVTRLLTAFYFREHGLEQETGDKTFEFTHKSFGEYLTASRIVKMIILISKQLINHYNDFDSGWDEREALKRWADLTKKTEITDYLLSFIEDEINIAPIIDVTLLQRTLAKLISHSIKNGLPFGDPRKNHLEETRHSRNSEAALIILHYACAMKTQIVSEINWEVPDEASKLFKRLRPAWPDGKLAYQSLGFIKYTNQLFYVQTLFESNFSNANLENTGFILSSLQDSNLSQANLSKADLSGANLSRSVLAGVNFSNALLKNANLRGADFLGADLSGADLSGADLDDVKNITLGQLKSCKSLIDSKGLPVKFQYLSKPL